MHHIKRENRNVTLERKITVANSFTPSPQIDKYKFSTNS